MHTRPALLLITLVRLYQRTLSRLIRLLLGNVCRFEPSCSSYAIVCLQRHGAVKGSLLSIARVCKCHPFHPGGHDPPPAADPAHLELGTARWQKFALKRAEDPGHGAG